MTSRARVLSAFQHVEPDRVPAWCGSSAEFWAKAKRELSLDDEGLSLRFGDDFRRVHARYVGPDFPLSPGATGRTPFGVERHGMGYGQPTSHPLSGALSSSFSSSSSSSILPPRQDEKIRGRERGRGRGRLRAIRDYSWPDPAWMDPSGIRADALRYRRQYAILGGDWSPFWHDAIDLLGMENLYLAMYDQPEVVDAVMGHLVGYYAAVSQRIFDAAGDAIDIFFIGNDLGSQTGPLLGEAFFRRFVLPHLVRLIDLGHAYGLKVMMHCCGGFAPLIPALIEARLDGLHAIQPCCEGMDLRTLKAEFGAKILFNGCIDSHHVLIKGTPGSVRERTREVVEIMKPSGGFVAGASHDSILEETPVENVVAMFDAIREFGGYAP